MGFLENLLNSKTKKTLNQKTRRTESQVGFSPLLYQGPSGRFLILIEIVEGVISSIIATVEEGKDDRRGKERQG